MNGIFNKIMSIDMDDDGPDQDNLHKSRFEGDNFRNRYMSKCQGESTAEKIARLERVKEAATMALSSYYNIGDGELRVYMYALSEEFES